MVYDSPLVVKRALGDGCCEQEEGMIGYGRRLTVAKQTQKQNKKTPVNKKEKHRAEWTVCVCQLPLLIFQHVPGTVHPYG